MPLFEYSAINDKGKTVDGSVNADTAKIARHKLREEGLLPITVIDISSNDITTLKKNQHSNHKISVIQLMLFTLEMSSLLKAGIEIEECLSSVAHTIENPRFKKIILGVHAKILEGYSLAAGLDDYPKAFPVVYRATVKAGEEAGYLGEVLEHLAKYLDKQNRIKQKIKQAMIYPSLLTIVSVAIVIFLLTYVTPKIVGLFEEGAHQLPLPTKILICISDFLQSYGIATLLGLLGTIVLSKYLMKSSSIRYKYHSFLLRIPFLGKIIRLIQTSRFMRAFAILTKSNVPILEALSVSSNLVDNLPIRATLVNAKNHIKEGTSIHSALRHTNFFSSVCLQFIANGEKSGNLEDMLLQASKQQERQVENTLESILILFEPILILIMGGVILFIVLAILLPMFQLSELVF